MPRGRQSTQVNIKKVIIGPSHVWRCCNSVRLLFIYFFNQFALNQKDLAMMTAQKMRKL